MLSEFKKFALRGNVIDLAIGVVIGAAFGKIVTSLVNDIIMPPLGLVIGNVDFSNLFISLSRQHYASLDEARKAGAATLNYGLFLNNVVDFLIIAFAIFLVMRQVNRLLVPPAVPTTKSCPYCVSTIPLQATRCPNCTSTLDVEAKSA